MVLGRIAPRAWRLRDPRCLHDPIPPCPAFVTPPRVLPPGEEPSAWGPVVRASFRELAGRREVRVAVEPGTSLYGTGEQAGPLLRNGTRKVAWCTDAFGYGRENPSLYQAHPWVLGVRADGSSFGVLVESTWRTEMDLCVSDPRAMVFRVDGPSPVVTVIEGRGPKDVVASLAALTGTIAMPPRWALGYQQSRWSYEPASRVEEVARGFRSRGLPCDVIWLDIDYMDRFRCFTWDAEKFPDPSGLMKALHGLGFKGVCMIDPGLAADPEYAVYRDAKQAGHLVTGRSHAKVSSVVSDDLASAWGLRQVEAPAESGGVYHGRVWPGACGFPDFTRSETRSWWAGLYKGFFASGIDGVWNDMNEPAIFDGPAKTMPLDNRHAADADLGGPGDHAKYHNVYGMQMIRATREGVVAARPEKRPFVLTRSNYLGGHRYAATWTGDNQARWDHLRWSVPMVLNLGLSGQPFSGPDIGGFCGPSTGAMFAAWMGVGCLLPFARGHKMKEWGGKPMPDHEPWSFGEDSERVCRRALERRYRLMPYLYTLFDEASRSGLPVCRPLFFADPADPRLRGVDNGFLLGDDVLVWCPVDGPDDLDVSPPPMPRGEWREFEVEADRVRGVGANEGREPLLPRLYLRAGALIPLGPMMQHTGEKPLDPLTLLVAPGASGEAHGVLYEDAGDGMGYLKGEFRRTHFVARPAPGGRSGVEIDPARVEGHWHPGERRTDVVVLAR